MSIADQDKKSFVVFGEHLDQRGNAIEVGLPLFDMRLHQFIEGTTGSGKSVTARNLALQCFYLGATVIVIEPHGDLVFNKKDGILSGIRERDLDRVALVDLAAEWVPQINLASAGFGKGGEEAYEIAAAMAMNCLMVVESIGFDQAVKMRTILESSLRLLLSVYGRKTSMVHWNRFLDDAAFRDKIISQSAYDVDVARSYWQTLITKWASSRKDTSADDLDPAARRVRKFLEESRFRRSLALPPLSPRSELSIAQLMDSPEASMILIPLTGKLGAPAKRVFGTLLMQQIAKAFKDRADQESEDRRTTVVIIDEFPDLAGSEVGVIIRNMLAQDRKYGAAVVLLAQSLDQLPAEVIMEIRKNTNNKMFLRVASGSGDDRLAKDMLGRPDLVGEAEIRAIDPYYGYTSHMSHNVLQPPYYFTNFHPDRLLFPDSIRNRILEREARGGGKVPKAFTHVPRDASPTLIEWHRRAQLNRDEVVLGLAALKEKQFVDMVKAQEELGQLIMRDLQQAPDLCPDPIERAKIYSRARLGYPTWMLDAWYRRNRY